MEIFQILKNKASRSIFWISAIKKMAKIWHFCEFFHFYPTLDYHKIRTRTNFENPNGKNLDLHLIMWFALKQLVLDSTDFTEAIFKMPQISKHFSPMLTMGTLRGYHEYIRGISWVHRGTFSTSGDTMSTSGGYHEYIGGNHDECGGASW